MGSIELREITAENRARVVALAVAPEQERFVGGGVAEALADADEYPEAKPWFRAIYAAAGSAAVDSATVESAAGSANAGDLQPVGFVMVSWNVTPDPPEIIGPW